MYTFTELLERIGVPRPLHKTRFCDVPGGEKVALWLKYEGRKTYRTGKNWYIVTSLPDHYKLLPMMVREYAYDRNLTPRYARLGTLITLLDTRDHKTFKLIAGAQLLAIADFFLPARGPRERPFTVLQRARLEEMLLQRDDERRSTLVQVHNPGHLAVNFMPWWTSSTMDRLAMNGLKVDDNLPTLTNRCSDL